MSERCSRCVATYGDSGRPAHFGSDPKCAFPDRGVFTDDNWNCATANAIRDHTFQDDDESRAIWNEDEYCAVLPWRDGPVPWLIVRWYKHRGCTNAILVLDDDAVRPITLAEAEAYLTDMDYEVKRRA